MFFGGEASTMTGDGGGDEGTSREIIIRSPLMSFGEPGGVVT